MDPRHIKLMDLCHSFT